MNAFAYACCNLCLPVLGLPYIVIVCIHIDMSLS